MQLLKYFTMIFLFGSAYSQTTPEGGQAVYELIPGTKNNVFELRFSNNSQSVIQIINIVVYKSPEWIEFSDSEIQIDKIENNPKPTVQFYFNISENATVGEEGKVSFRITDQTGRKWFKSYSVKVSPPKVFAVYQNYPNPFNPSTTIKYSIPQDEFVMIKIFNVLGEKVTELMNGEMKAGIHESVFNAANISSGIYFYTVEAKGQDGKKYFDSKKMLMLK